MRKPTICICENKDADQLRGNREADQRLCFRYIDSTIPLRIYWEVRLSQPRKKMDLPDMTAAVYREGKATNKR